MISILKNLGRQIDEACDVNNEQALISLIEDCSIALKEAVGTDRPILYYFTSNAYSGIVTAKYDVEYAWLWDQPEAVLELFNLRLAVNEDHFEDLNIVIQCQIRTNLANRLNSLGRCIEAIEHWDAALRIIPKFAKALGNRAYGLQCYSRLLYDHNHRSILLHNASKDVASAIGDDAYWDTGEEPATKNALRARLDSIEAYLDQVGYQRSLDLNAFDLGETQKEQDYRQWCLNNRMFLNPLNDALTDKVAASDFQHLPSHTYNFEEEPRFPVYYNHMKQEYASARFRYYNAIQLNGYHFSDHEVVLYDNGDAGQFGHHTEELKSAFRAAYSLFDKVGIFINDYFKVGLNPYDATFRRVWSQKVKGGKNELRDVFKDRKNWPLRGLFYLSKDIFDDEFSELAEPDAQELAKIRNYAEHRFITLQAYSANVKPDEYRFAITTDKFADKTLRVLKMARACLIYLSLAMLVEEEEKEKNNKDRISFPLLGGIPILRPWDIDNFDSEE